MKPLAELDLPEDARYSEDHEWARREGETVKAGISDYAQDQLGEIVFVDLPKEGDVFERGAVFGSLESVKAVTEILMPVGGKLLKINEALEGSPELVNKAPHTDGWMIVIKPNDPNEFKALLSRDAYLDFIKGLQP